MDLKQLKTYQANDFVLSKIQSNMVEFCAQVQKNQFISGNLISATIATTGTVINHGLGVTPLGWIILDKTANSNVWRTVWSDKTITLRASVDVAVKLWVF